MKRNPILYILLAILIAQPLLVVGFGPTMTTNAIHADDTIVPSQGTRLAPDAHTDHVPVLIHSNADFGVQGWPGAGTPGDPYIISGLNITYDIGSVAIEVHDVDASFVIRDCYIGQLSGVSAVEFINTTAGVIEYTTIHSDGGGIYCFNANNTQIIDSLVVSNAPSSVPSPYAIAMYTSLSCHLENNIFNSTDYRCAWFEISHNLESITNVYHGDPGWFHMTFHSCNFTSLTGDSLINGYIGLRFYSSHGVTVDDIEISTMQRGVLVQNSPDFSITGSSITIWGGYGVYMDNCDTSIISDCTVDGPGDLFGLIYTTNSEWLTITGNTLSNSANHGILVSGAHNSTINSNTITDCSPNGILVGDSHDCEVSSNIISGSLASGIEVSTSHRIVMNGNDISETITNGIYVEYSDNGTLSNSVIAETTDACAYFDDCDNWQINDNIMSDAGVGIELWMGSFTDVWSNDISDIQNEGISANTHGMLETWENTVTNADTGLYFTDCDNLYIRYETVSECVTGIFVDQSEESEFSENVITDCTDIGIDIWQLANTSFIHNTLTNCEPYGFYIEYGTNLTFTDNILTEGGFYFTTDASLSDVNHTFSGNTVNGLPLSYGKSLEHLDLDGNSYGQIILVNCSESEITGGSFRLSATIYLHTCENVNISDVIITDHIYGIVIRDSENITIRDSDITGNYDWSDTGIYALSVGWLTVVNVDITTSESGIYLQNSHYAIIDECTLYDSEYLIGIYESSGGIIIDCELSYAGTGIYLGWASLGWNVSRNEIKWCESGMETNYADFMNLSLNDFHDCFVGVYYWDTYDCLVYNNTFLWNVYGMVLENCDSGPIIYFNVFLNFDGNAYDDSVNDWDDWVDTGNYWHDYSGTGTYAIDGGVAIDNYPMQYIATEPIINEAWDDDYPEGDTGNEIYWYVYDDYLNTYSVTIDGNHWTSDVVSDLYFADIVVNIDGLSYGEHTVVITVYDVDMNSVSDTVLIDVWDNTDPTVDNPPNIEVFLGIDGNTVVWEADDLNPDTYVITMDGSEFATGSWTSTITLNLNGLSAGVHDFVLTVYDQDDNAASDSVSILVINDDTAPTIDSPEDLVFVAGTTGNWIIWTPLDTYPDRFEITFNDTVVAEGDWGGGPIIFELDNLEVGNYNFTLTVWDGGQQSTSDMVGVQVIPYEGWQPEEILPPPDFTLLIIAGVGITGAIVVIGVIYYFKIKKPKSGGA